MRCWACRGRWRPMSRLTACSRRYRAERARPLVYARPCWDAWLGEQEGGACSLRLLQLQRHLKQGWGLRGVPPEVGVERASAWERRLLLQGRIRGSILVPMLLCSYTATILERVSMIKDEVCYGYVPFPSLDTTSTISPLVMESSLARSLL